MNTIVSPIEKLIGTVIGESGVLALWIFQILNSPLSEVPGAFHGAVRLVGGAELRYEYLLPKGITKEMILSKVREIVDSETFREVHRIPLNHKLIIETMEEGMFRTRIRFAFVAKDTPPSGTPSLWRGSITLTDTDMTRTEASESFGNRAPFRR